MLPFLLVNSGSVELVEAPKDVKLPESRVEFLLDEIRGLEERAMREGAAFFPKYEDFLRLSGCYLVEEVVERIRHSEDHVVVGMVGKYVDLTESYKSLSEALIHAGIHTRTRVRIRYIDSEVIEQSGLEVLGKADAVLVPGGFDERGVEGKIMPVRYAREHGIPYLGICLGMQVAVIEFARNVAGLEDAQSTEFRADTPHPVIGLITEWQDQTGSIERRDANSDLGGTMRLGGQLCKLKAGTLAQRVYGKDEVIERHRHRYEFNNRYRETLEQAGLTLSGTSADGSLVEVVEIADHPWFLACQFHPEFTSTPRDGHPLFIGFVEAAIAQRSRVQQDNEQACLARADG